LLIQNYANFQKQSLFYTEYGFPHFKRNEAERGEVETSLQFGYATQEVISTNTMNGVAMNPKEIPAE